VPQSRRLTAAVLLPVLRGWVLRVGACGGWVGVQLRWSLNDEPVTEKDDEESRDPEYRKGVKCTIFLGYTSNMISSGVREIIRYLCQHKLVDVIVSSAGGIEEDFIKCFAPTYCVGDFSLDGCALRLKGQNRIGAWSAPAQRVPLISPCVFFYD
jgi:deoxyhypusine synthase